MTDPAVRPWRCFWAVPLPADLRASLADAMAAVRRDEATGEAWRWTDPEGWHVTLAFLGAIAPEAIEGMLAAVRAVVTDEEPFTIGSGGLGSFPSASRARVLWYGLHDPEHRLRELARRVQAAAGLDDEDRFRPHVTLARSRDRRGALPPAVTADVLPDGQLPVRDITLLRSHLGAGPANYEVLAEIALRHRVRAAVS